MFKGGVQNTEFTTQIKAFVKRYLTRVLVQLPFDDERRLSLAGIHLDYAIRQIAVFYGRNARHYFHTLDIRILL